MNDSPPSPDPIASETEQVQVRYQKLAKLKEGSDNVYPNGFTPTALAAPLHAQFDEKTKDELESQPHSVSVAGRVMAIRDFGKAAFLRIQDRTGLIQVYVQLNRVKEEAFALYKELDHGDIIFAEGLLFKTKTNELSVQCESFKLLVKALRPLPEKYHGIADVEIKYRQRYLDLMMSEETKKIFSKRSKMIQEVRQFLIERQFLEVETPMMHPLVGGAAARPFTTHHNTLDMKLYMRIAPELYLKRLVVGGMERVFEINRNFRNEGMSIKHNPEFTMLEFYQAYATYEDLITLIEELFQHLAHCLLESGRLSYQGTAISLQSPWQRLKLEDAILQLSDFKDAAQLRNPDALLAYGKQKNLHMDPKSSVGALMMRIFDEEVEAKLIQPTFITHYPLDVSPLSRTNEEDPFVVDRFELFIYGREMANAFSELNDPVDQRNRFEDQVKARMAGDEEASEQVDEDYVRALEYGLPPTAGAGIGIDRLAMLFMDVASIRDVILFPLMKPQG